MKEQIFKKIKKSLLKERLLRIFNPKKLLRIKVDISDYIMTGIVMQDGQSMKFISYNMNSAEQNYTITEKEMLVIIQAMKK